jgi:hypothetical protein
LNEIRWICSNLLYSKVYKLKPIGDAAKNSLPQYAAMCVDVPNKTCPTLFLNGQLGRPLEMPLLQHIEFRAHSMDTAISCNIAVFSRGRPTPYFYEHVNWSWGFLCPCLGPNRADINQLCMSVYVRPRGRPTHHRLVLVAS